MFEEDVIEGKEKVGVLYNIFSTYRLTIEAILGYCPQEVSS